MRRLLVAVCFLMPFGALPALAGAQGRAPVEQERARLLGLINAYRAEHGAPPLALSATLQRAADGHSGDMASRDFFDHVSPEGRTPFARAAGAGYPSQFVGENIAAGNADAARTFEQWRSSPAHDEALRNPRYHAAGLGYAARQGSTYRHYWTLLLGDRVDTPLGAPAPAAERVPPPSADDDGDAEPEGWGRGGRADRAGGRFGRRGRGDRWRRDASGGQGWRRGDVEDDGEGERGDDAGDCAGRDRDDGEVPEAAAVPVAPGAAAPAAGGVLPIPPTLDLAALQQLLARFGLALVRR